MTFTHDYRETVSLESFGETVQAGGVGLTLKIPSQGERTLRLVRSRRTRRRS